MRGEYREAFVLDVGSTSVRLLIGSMTADSGIEIRYEAGRISGLGHALRGDGRLPVPAVEETLRAVREILLDAGDRLPDRGACVCTHAVRRAVNAGEILDGLTTLTGLKPEVLTPHREGVLAWQGSRELLGERSILVDLGGGSTEIVRRKDRDTFDVLSIPVGAGTAIEDHLEAADETWRRWQGITGFRLDKSGTMVVLGGTATTLVAIARNYRRYIPGKLHGVSVSCADPAAVLTFVSILDPVSRRQIPSMEPGREEIIVTGGRLLMALCRILGADSLVISERGIRFGRLLELIEGI
ncbi:MAG TPA: hypothetical protein PLV45_07740 [bacterium]|nr:hypothetical protein [bacterium]